MSQYPPQVLRFQDPYPMLEVSTEALFHILQTRLNSTCTALHAKYTLVSTLFTHQ